MNQSRYMEKIRSKFNMGDCKRRSTPCETEINKISDEDEFKDNKLYQKNYWLSDIYHDCNETRYLQ